MFADGYCNSHYKRKWRYGDPLAGGPFRNRPVEERLRDLYVVEPNGCWRYTAGLDGMGYGALIVNRRTVRAHRLSYETFVGPIPDGLDIDHLCRNKACINPAHLEPVTHSENLLRHYAQRRSCPQGHPYDESNTYRDTSGKRRCRACARERQKVRRASRRLPPGP